RRRRRPEPLGGRRHPAGRGAQGPPVPVREPARGGGRERMRPSAAVLALLGLAGCATSGAFRAGEKAEGREDYDRAVLEYSKAVQQDPNDVHYRKGLERARLRAAEAHALNARRLGSRGMYKEALDEFRLA